MSEDLIICPNCGANLTELSNIKHCEYCGYMTQIEDSDDCDNIEERVSNINIQFHPLLIHNQSLIQSSNHIKVIRWDNASIDVEMARDYSPRIRYSVYSKIRLNIKYICNDAFQEEMYIVVDADFNLKTPMFIETTYKQIVLVDYHSDQTNRLYFKLSLTDFLFICHSCSDDIFTNIGTDGEEYVNFDEFIHYCRRFYNQCLLKEKFIYSINKHLICD